MSGFIRPGYNSAVMEAVIEYLVLGMLQGITEWLPLSSEGVIVLAKAGLFGGGSLQDVVRQALFLHLGTFLAALLYFRRDVVDILKALPSFIAQGCMHPRRGWSVANGEAGMRRFIVFLALATVVSGVLGGAAFMAMEGLDMAIAGQAITLAVGMLLVFTAVLQLRATVRPVPVGDGRRLTGGSKGEGELIKRDGLLLGVCQGLAALPGVSRSGITVSALLLRGFDKTRALRFSFIMSLPIVLAGNILLNLDRAVLRVEALAGLVSAFFFGILTIHALIRLSRRVNFGYFVLGFGVLVLISGLLLV